MKLLIIIIHDGGDHISLYLLIANTDKLPSGWEVNVNAKFFLFNQIENQYPSVQDVDGRIWRFHCLKTEFGLDQLLPLSTFSDPTNGYLIDDSCSFGAEMYVIKPNNATFACVNLSKPLEGSICPLKIRDFSKMKKTEVVFSPEFIMGGWRWKLKFFPNGDGCEVGKSISCYLHFVDLESLCDSKVGLKFKIRIIDQLSGGKNEKEASLKLYSSGSLLGSSEFNSWGFPAFLSLKDLKDAKKHYLLDDTLLLEVEISDFCKVDVI